MPIMFKARSSTTAFYRLFSLEVINLGKK